MPINHKLKNEIYKYLVDATGIAEAIETAFNILGNNIK